MRRPRELLALVPLLVALGAAGAAAEEPAANDSVLGSFELGSRKEPIVITADTLEYDHKKNVVVYRGTREPVEAVQGPVRLRSDTLTVVLEARGGDAGGRAENPLPGTDGATRVQQIVAVGSVRIENGTRWATGGRAVFDQVARTLVLSESPVLHDGTNEVAGERVVVYLDQDRSEVEGGRRRVKAVLHPGKDGGSAQAKEGAGK